MNKICRRFEKEFDGYLKRRSPDVIFDLSILKSGTEYTKAEFREVSKLYNSYCSRIRHYMAYASREHVDETEYASMFIELRNEFDLACSIACPNVDSLCDIIMDLCYTKSSTKKFAWDMCGREMIKNLLAKNDSVLKYPTVDPDGDIMFCGKRFRVERIELEEDNGNCVE